MALRELWGVKMFSWSTLQGCKNLAQRNWESNKAIISSRKQWCI